MRVRRYQREKELREPEKTPLIDMIFLLLIFFFVSLSVIMSESARVPTGNPKKEAVPLLPQVASTQAVPSEGYIVVELYDISQLPAQLRDMLNQAHRKLAQLAALVPGTSAPPPLPRFGVLFCVGLRDRDDWVLQAYLRDVLKTPLEPPPTNVQIASLLRRFPLAVSYSEAQSNETLSHLANAILQESGNEVPPLHARVTAKVQSRALLTLYDLVARLGLSQEDLRIRAIGGS